MAGGGGRNHQADRRGGGLPLPGLAQQEKRMTGKQGAPVQASRRRQVEQAGAAAKLKQDRAKNAGAGGLLRHPERIRKLGRLGNQQPIRREAETLLQPRRVGPPGLAKNLRRADP